MSTGVPALPEPRCGGMWIDQWGVVESAGGDRSGQDKYLDDVLGLFEEYDLHWTYWIWRRTFNDCPGGFATFCKLSNGATLQIF